MTHPIRTLGRHAALIAAILAAPVAAILAGPASAQTVCVAEYKAKQDNPLRLQHGEMAVASCDPARAADEVRVKLASRGWILLKIIAVKG
ncbi:hypothetical protein [Pseudooceanicola sp.]|uniref:hypothetical protein n=1 Tax=Pseudooceanicola sp. TaxID=1914328 RepID=UPI004059C0A2|tara:strand:- start:7305 stop:7574 length:270 start_codon:yes stop_codon:yes gene_type:complete